MTEPYENLHPVARAFYEAQAKYIKKAVQIGNSINDIISLPCVYGVCKAMSCREARMTLVYQLEYFHMVRPPFAGVRTKAEQGDWLCELDNDMWMVLIDEEYKEYKEGRQ